jgi:hypothetical protein
MIHAGVMAFVRRCMVRNLCSDKTLKVPMRGAWLQVGVVVTYQNCIWELHGYQLA